MIEVYPIGTRVVVNVPEEMLAMVTAISIRGDAKVSYECVWWDGRSRCCQWLEACEVLSRSGERAKIGFKQ